MTELLHPEEVITSIVFVRHGDTKATEEGLLYTDPQAPLTQKGVSQAHALAIHLSKLEFDELLSSPSQRVLSTAEVVSKSTDKPINIIDGLNEWSVGEWEGRSYLDIKKRDPDLYHKWSKNPIENAPPGGESISQMCLRVSNQIETIISQYAGKRLVLVTHAGIIRSAITKALQMPEQNFWRTNIHTGSLTKIDFSPSFALVQYLGLRL